MSEKQNVFDYTLFIKGLFGRNRSIKFDSFKLAEDCAEKMPLDQVRKLTEEKIGKLKPKGNYWIKVCEYPSEIELMDGVRFKSTRIILGNDAALIQEMRS